MLFQFSSAQIKKKKKVNLMLRRLQISDIKP